MCRHAIVLFVLHESQLYATNITMNYERKIGLNWPTCPYQVFLLQNKQKKHVKIVVCFCILQSLKIERLQPSVW